MFFKKTQQREQPAPQTTESNETPSALHQKIQQAALPAPIAAAAMAELERLEKTDPSAPEYAIGLNYIDLILSLPWNTVHDIHIDLNQAERVMESQHHGLRQVKERILEYLAVRTLCSMRDFFILIVDDEPIARTNLEYVLKKEGYRVDTAGNGLEALERMKSQEFDLILTDMKMEKMDGFQLLETARKISPRTDIVLITGYATVNSAVAALKKGATHYLPKPINLDELRETIREIRGRKRALQCGRSPILCFTGPPGTGKTSIGRSIAESLERPFVRVSVAGLRDEADLRGHRRTYVGAMPGRILNEIRRVNARNPVFMLDEIDKIGQDFRGDPASVLLEILDPEQNSHFTDHYLDLPFDLSAVLFITTANGIENLPAALRDRMEVIAFTGYTETEKRQIAFRYLIPRQLQEHGLTNRGIGFSEEAVSRLIQDYTQEAGVRNLEREIAAVCRKLARICLLQESGAGGQQPDQASKADDAEPAKPIRVDEQMVVQFLGPRRYNHMSAETAGRIGVVTGLVWTEFGGEIISVEAGIMKGKEQLLLTGSLGDILRESAQTALSYVRSHAEILGIDPDFFQDRDIHIHIPAGAIPKEGSSAGLTIAMALLSLLTRRPAKPAVAMTGELTLSGTILQIAGLREKLLAAQRAGVATVIIPKANAVDLAGMDREMLERIEIVLAEDIQTLIDVVLEMQ
ncbi:endopeptidase La [Desulfatirhabdium butyrativorans]|uniref:endopeptidase La n=1 Tax=Desulfatirhabdium butyrativorans TaxID=340467 RepID=UPI00041EC1E2|nr:endopeptidase La [Desulfatirhabdium butyrativorans]